MESQCEQKRCKSNLRCIRGITTLSALVVWIRLATPPGSPGRRQGARRQPPERRAEGEGSAAPLLLSRRDEGRKEEGEGTNGGEAAAGGSLGHPRKDSRHQGLEERRHRRYQAGAGSTSPFASRRLWKAT